VKAQGFLAAADINVVNRVDARKDARDVTAAVELARAARHVFVARGRTFRHVDLATESISDEELAGLITGRSGTLRAPTLRRGKSLIVGYSDELYEEMFG